jgi:branched-subunit amino acid transport protein AzlD
MRLLGIIGLVYALLLPIFGRTQATLLVGSLHWIIQAAHLSVGIGAVAFMGMLGPSFLHLKQVHTKEAPAR